MDAQRLKELTTEEDGSFLTPDMLPVPLGCKVIVRPATAVMTKQIKTNSGETVSLITGTDETRGGKDYRRANGYLLAIGELAFTGGNWEGFNKETLPVGSHIIYERFAGLAGKEYKVNGVKVLVLHDDSIHALVPETAKVATYTE